ncbi:PREDICTED: osteopetrosis-associated transmembrane protein 1 [Poecilia mexicana]|uniref:Osteoclastogenesis associated transmembrane protein 1 n=1 Tax=Poecilia mexicana TaxID=48701 RepID=A0A3B3WXL1_9TELE|nr:PREDICTED: osteopetrosis-associated transmembrane protein 1 [Poecilia mexicana]
MSLHRYELGFLLIILNIYSLGLIDAVNVTASDSAANPLQAPSYQSHGSSAVVSSPVYKPAVDSSYSINLLSSFPEDVEISEYCSEMLRLFGQRYVAYVNCLIPAARPVRVCQNCSPEYKSLSDVFLNISSDQMGPGNVSCRDSILRSDRLMLVFLLYGNLATIWEKSNCKQCVTTDFKGPNNDTLYYLTLLNQTITCFEKYKEGNHTELCKNCIPTYKDLNDMYSGMEKNSTLCIDLEDSMNMTRKLWSKNFGCSYPHGETIPVIAVSSFMLFLPIIFYLSSFLHSEQKKRKLIHPKRAKSHNSLMNIQDKQS